MSRLRKIIINIVVWGALAAYLMLSARYCTHERDNTLVSKLQVVVLDSTERRLVTHAMVRRWLKEDGIELRNREVRRVNTVQIEESVTKHGFVKKARVYTNLDGNVVIEITQRKPIARVSIAGDRNFYITDDSYILPLVSHEVLYVPVVTGNFTPPFAQNYTGKVDDALNDAQKKSSKNYTFFTNLINFVNYMEGNDFWNAQIVQINVKNPPSTSRSGATDSEWYSPQVEIVPRAGDHVIMIGELENAPSKLSKLMRFYRGALEHEGWDRYSYIDLRFSNQIVCKK